LGYSSTLKMEAASSLKFQLTFNGLHGVISQKAELFREITCLLNQSMAFLQCMNAATIAVFPAWSNAVTVKVQQLHTVKSSLHTSYYRRCQKCSPSTQIHSPGLHAAAVLWTYRTLQAVYFLLVLLLSLD
jgi:hypothetical protein